MEIFEYEPFSSEAMHCPSTGEDIFAPDMEGINESAEAFIGYWHHEVIDQPSIRDEKIRAAWDKVYQDFMDSEDDDIDLREEMLRFFEEYDNPNWKVYECHFSGIACGPISFTVWYVVQKDVVFEDRDLDLD